MENKILETIKIDDNLKEVKIDNDTLLLVFDKSTIKLDYCHVYDCCESVWADFDIVKHYIDQLSGSFQELVIKGVEEMGILLCFKHYYGPDTKIFIPCYNEQNGYYSDNLQLIIEHNGIKKEIDITSFKEDKID